MTSLQQRLVKTGGRLVKHARYYWLLLAEGHLHRRLFGNMLRRIWALPVPAFGALVARIPPPMAIGTVELADGSRVKGFLCEDHAIDEAGDITAHGGWRAYLGSVAATTGDRKA